LFAGNTPKHQTTLIQLSSNIVIIPKQLEEKQLTTVPTLSQSFHVRRGAIQISAGKESGVSLNSFHPCCIAFQPGDGAGPNV
jgi:hypothetical protein